MNALIRLPFACALLLLSAACAPSPHAVFDMDHDLQTNWETTRVLASPDGAVDAVLQVGTPRGNANTVPIRRLRLQTRASPATWGNNVVVWESTVMTPPTFTWSAAHHVVITQAPHEVLGWMPALVLDGQDYSVDVEMKRAAER